MDKEFWKKKKLSDFSEKEWESVCLRCGKCCLLKEVKNNIIFFSNHICNNFDLKTGKCSCYKQRVGPSCAKVDLQLLQTQRELLPETCAYRLLFEGKELPDYHPLISGDSRSVHKARRTVLEMPFVYTEREVMKAAEQAVRLPYDKAAQLLERYKFRYLEYYNIPPENQAKN